MAKISTKTRLLDEAGFAYNFDRMMYINRQTKKAFSVEFVDDSPESVIKSSIREPNEGSHWHFYTNVPISEGTKKELEKVLR